MKHKKWVKNQHDEHKHDHYVNPHVIRIMKCIIAKQWWEHKRSDPIKHGWSQKAIHVCQWSNNHGIQHTNQNMKHQNKNHKHPYDHYVYACALDLEHTY